MQRGESRVKSQEGREQRQYKMVHGSEFMVLMITVDGIVYIEKERD